jgi:hypothetical protein
VESAVFTNPNVQNQIDKLSKRSHGIKDDSQDERVHSDLKGSFKLGDAPSTSHNFPLWCPELKPEEPPL